MAEKSATSRQSPNCCRHAQKAHREGYQKNCERISKMTNKLKQKIRKTESVKELCRVVFDMGRELQCQWDDIREEVSISLERKQTGWNIKLTKQIYNVGLWEEYTWEELLPQLNVLLGWIESIDTQIVNQG